MAYLLGVKRHAHRLVVGYHGCDRAVAERVLLDGVELTKSANEFDWLGEGIYFWEHSELRAWEFAAWKQARGEIERPAVLGAYISLGRCFDLTDREATTRLARIYDEYKVEMEAVSRPLGENRSGRGGSEDLLLRDLDCAVLNFGMTNLDRSEGSGGRRYQTVRGVFVEGPPAYPGAAIRSKTHIQIAVRDPACILG